MDRDGQNDQGTTYYSDDDLSSLSSGYSDTSSLWSVDTNWGSESSGSGSNGSQ